MKTQKSVKVLLIVCVMVVTIQIASGAIWGPFFDNSSGDQLWTTATNWNTDVVPGPDNRCVLDWAGGTPVIINASMGEITVNQIYVGHEGDGGLDMMSGTLNTIGGQFYLSGDWGRTGTLNMYDGTVNISSDMLVSANNGVGILNMYGGAINITGALHMAYGPASSPKNEAYVYLHGGTLTADQLTMRIQGSVGPAVLEIGGDGTLLLNGDLTARIQEYMDSDWIIGLDGATVGYDLTSNPGYTTVHIVPEPMTMTLLGLGSLVLIRRRHNAREK